MKTKMNKEMKNDPIKYSIQVAICDSFEFMEDFNTWNIRKKDCRDIGIDDETNMFRFREHDDQRVRLCN